MDGRPIPADLHARLCKAIPLWVNDVFSVQANVQAKGNDGLDLVTSLDLAMQARLEHELQALLPGSLVIGEEHYKPHDGTGPFWLVDPLDGTVNFVAGIPAYSVAAVLLVDGTPFLSVVHDVIRGDTYSALHGKGAFLNGAALTPSPHMAKLAVVSTGLIKDLGQNAPRVLDQLLSSFKLRNFGSQALHLCFAAAGKVSLVASREAKAWDDMAGALIAREAGLLYGSYRPDGQTAAYDQDQCSLCAAPGVFSMYRTLFAEGTSRPGLNGKQT